MAYGKVLYGETTQLTCEAYSRDDEAFTITSATITITDEDGTKLRDAVAATVDNTTDRPRAYYTETFTATDDVDNPGVGYAEGGQYKALFILVIGSNTEEHEDVFVVEAVRGLP